MKSFRLVSKIRKRYSTLWNGGWPIYEPINCEQPLLWPVWYRIWIRWQPIQRCPIMKTALAASPKRRAFVDEELDDEIKKKRSEW